MSWDVLKRRGIRELGGEGLQLGRARGRVKRQATNWPCKRLLRPCHVREENGKFGPAVRRACMVMEGTCAVNWLAWRCAMHVGFTSCKKKKRKGCLCGLGVRMRVVTQLGPKLGLLGLLFMAVYLGLKKEHKKKG